jgi:hypothetical protein
VAQIERYFGTLQYASDLRAVVTFSRNNQSMVDGVQVWSSPAEGPCRIVKEIRPLANQVVFSPDLCTMATLNVLDDATKPVEIDVWDTATGGKRGSTPFTCTSFDRFSFAADGKMLVASGNESAPAWLPRTTLWRVSSSVTLIGSFNVEPAVSPDGKWLAIPQNNGAKLYRLAGMLEHAQLTDKQDSPPTPPSGPPFPQSQMYPSILFSPDSQLVAIAGLYRHPQKLSLQRGYQLGSAVFGSAPTEPG